MDKLSNITVTKIEDIITIHSHKGRYLDMKKRPYMGLSFCSSGKITYSHMGKEYISDPDSAVILPQGASYTLYGNETGDFQLINFFCSGFEPETFSVIKLNNSKSYIKDFERMHSLSLFEGKRASVMSVFYDIISRLSSEGNAESSILAPAVEYIHQNYTDPYVNNKLLAELCNLSEVYFRKLFKAHNGITPGQYIINTRIRRAKQLLCDGKLSVSEISEQSGFSSVYHFCRAFKNKTGMTPTEYSKNASHFII